MTASRQLDGQIAIVTGGGRGIGWVLATALRDVGAQVAVFDVDEASALACAEALGDSVGVGVDVTDEDAVRNAMALVTHRFGRLDLLVNNAAITGRMDEYFGTSALDVSVAAWRRVLDVNLTGAFICAQQAARQMSGGGSIVNIASVQGLCATRGTIHYATSKAGIIMFTKCLAGELAGLGIRVNAVAPGPIITSPEMDQERKRRNVPDTLSGRWGTPEDVANAVIYLASPAAHFVNGHVLAVDDGVSVRFRESLQRQEV